MTLHKSVLTAPTVCTVEQLLAFLADCELDTPVMVAMGENEEGGLDVAQVHSVSTIKEPLEGSEVVLIVPSGAIGKWFDEVSEMEAGIAESHEAEGEGEEPS